MQDPRYPDEVKSVVAGIQLAYKRLGEHSSQAAGFYPYLALFPGGLPEAGVEPIFGPDARRLIAQIGDQALLERPWPDLLYLPTPFRLFAGQLLGDEEAARRQYGEAVLRFYLDFRGEDPDNLRYIGHIPGMDEAMLKGKELAPVVIARYAHELPSIEGWLDWALEHEPCRGGRVRAPHITALLENLYTVTGLLYQEETFERYHRALECARRCKDRLGEANTLQAIGDVLNFRKELDQALARYEEALGLFRAVGDRLGEANTLASMSHLALQRGDDEWAKALLQQAMDLHTAIGARYSAGADLGNFGLVLRGMGRLEEARPYLLQAAEVFEQAGLVQQAQQARQMAGVESGELYSA